MILSFSKEPCDDFKVKAAHSYKQRSKLPTLLRSKILQDVLQKQKQKQNKKINPLVEEDLKS